MLDRTYDIKRERFERMWNWDYPISNDCSTTLLLVMWEDNEKLNFTSSWIGLHFTRLNTLRFRFAKSRRYNNSESCWLIKNPTHSYKKYQITMTQYKLRYKAHTNVYRFVFEWLICISIKMHTFWHDKQRPYVLLVIVKEKQRKNVWLFKYLQQCLLDHPGILSMYHFEAMVVFQHQPWFQLIFSSDFNCNNFANCFTIKTNTHTPQEILFVFLGIILLIRRISTLNSRLLWNQNIN